MSANRVCDSGRFPEWPKDVATRFTTFRAEGAFLVGAARSDGEVIDGRDERLLWAAVVLQQPLLAAECAPALPRAVGQVRAGY